jgi:RNA polymerase sigma factor (sigma-70 family)
MSVSSKIFLCVPGVEARDADEAWDRFLADHASLVLQVVHLFTRDDDQVHDCFVFVCEKLRKDDLRKIRKFKPGGAASFPTWLRAVTRNLCLDWLRTVHGRPRPYRSIKRLPQLEREIFRAVHMQKLTESEAFSSVKVLYPSLDWSGFRDCLVRIERALSSHQSWLLTSSSPSLLSLSSSARDPLGRESDTEIPDSEHDPEEDAARHEYLDALQRALDGLTKKERLVLRLRFEQELTLPQIARLTRLDGARAVQAVIAEALDALRNEIASVIANPVSVKDS